MNTECYVVKVPDLLQDDIQVFLPEADRYYVYHADQLHVRSPILQKLPLNDVVDLIYQAGLRDATLNASKKKKRLRVVNTSSHNDPGH